jgi:hypothetical protein
MRMFIVSAIAIVAIAIGYSAKTALFPSQAPAALSTVATRPNTLSPHEIHLNYKAMKDLPVHHSNNAH